MDYKKKREIMEHYNLMGGRIYDIRYKDEQKSKYDRLLHTVSIKQHQVILDDGCGTGLLMKKIKTYVIGVDISWRLVSTARKRLKKRYYASLIISDAEELPIRSNVFDFIFSVTLLQNLSDSIKSLNEMKRVMKMDGKIITTTLKKALDAFTFRKSLESSGFHIDEMILDDDFDWMAVISSQ
ncbi:MAG: class I SAM-dependent methyltransferase [Candidatus Bathyarchaeia archaeon]